MIILIFLVVEFIHLLPYIIGFLIGMLIIGILVRLIEWIFGGS